MTTSNVQVYRELCEKELSIPLFSQAWWLDATAGPQNWNVALVQKGNEISAALPYAVKNRYGVSVVGQPPLTQSLGPWMRDYGGKACKKLAQQKEWMEELISLLPPFHRYSQNWSWKITNWLPFYWSGFQQTTRYTYILHDLSCLDSIWDDMQVNIRGDVRKAEGRFKIKVVKDAPFDDFIRLNMLTFKRQNIAMPYTKHFLEAFDFACEKKKSRKIFIAEDESGRQHAGVYIVWDHNSAYYLMGGGDPELRSSGATSLCMWEAIKFAATVSRKFDFEGSMMEPVERFFRGFGAEQTPYFSVSKNSSRLLQSAFFIKEIVSRK